MEKQIRMMGTLKVFSENIKKSKGMSCRKREIKGKKKNDKENER